MNQEVKNNWVAHFLLLEVKTNNQVALEKVLDQIILILDQRGVSKEEIKGGMWASLTDSSVRAFGLMLLYDNQLEFIGAIPGEGKLKTWEWSFQNIQIQKQEDAQLGITKSITLQNQQKQYKWEGMKGFVPSIFVQTLEKYWYKA